ncbi:MAG: DNA polymerase III subunit [Thermodesulfovibrionales bacterium]|nr:DNA polymerase III subunit [Thermodesulfovibrionales bacterium]MDP3110806.1 DNA polymerase III subunit [Thermodesulfovibrionales bacterium]
MALKDIIGQEKAINILLGTLSQDRIPSSYLFAGESGIGKKFTAVNFAKTLNCQHLAGKRGFILRSATENGSGEARGFELPEFSASELPDFRASGLQADCCDECPSCKKIDSQTHPDFMMVTPEKSEIRVEEVRAIEEALSFAPYEGKRKVVIVDEAEAMNASAANAFLKTLEEPPPQSIIILIASSPDRLPETIRSRCSRINFLPLSAARCEEVIKNQAGVRGQGLEKDSQLSTISRLSMGRPGLAISNDLIEERDWFIRLFRGMVHGENKETWGDKEEIEKWFNYAITVLRDTAVFKITGQENMLINIDLKDSIAGMSKTIELKDIIESYIKLTFLKGYLRFNLNKSITWNYTGFILRKFTGFASPQASR